MSSEGEVCDVYVNPDDQDYGNISKAVGPPMDNNISKEDLVDSLAEYMMVNRGGFSPTKDDYPVEWDRDVKDSQISLIIDDIELILDFLEETYEYDFSSPQQKTIEQ